MHILGLANGSQNGNSTILVKAALRAAKSSLPEGEISTSWVHMPSVSYPPNAGPLQHAPDISLGANAGNNVHGDDAKSSQSGKGTAAIVDDRLALYEQIMRADALIVVTAVYSHQPAGTLKSALDKILGPYTDAAFASRVLAAQRAGEPNYKNIRVDERVLNPRVAAFLAVGGSTTQDQFSLALPGLHLLTSGLHAKVVDQDVITGCANPGAVVGVRDGAAVTRAEELGRRVASQMGRVFDEAVYLGPEVEGACPECHLAKYDFFGGEEMRVGCVVCGNTGQLVEGPGNKVAVQWDEASDYCCIRWRGKEKHVDDIFKNGSAEWKGLQGSEEKVQEWRDLHVGRVTLPSEQASVVSSLARVQL